MKKLPGERASEAVKKSNLGFVGAGLVPALGAFNITNPGGHKARPYIFSQQGSLSKNARKKHFLAERAHPCPQASTRGKTFADWNSALHCVFRQTQGHGRPCPYQINQIGQIGRSSSLPC